MFQQIFGCAIGNLRLLTRGQSPSWHDRKMSWILKHVRREPFNPNCRASTHWIILPNGMIEELLIEILLREMTLLRATLKKLRLQRKCLIRHFFCKTFLFQSYFKLLDMISNWLIYSFQWNSSFKIKFMKKIILNPPNSPYTITGTHW